MKALRKPQFSASLYDPARVSDDFRAYARVVYQTLMGQYDNEAPWDAVSELRSNGSRETFEVAAQWLQDSEPLKKCKCVVWAVIIGGVRVMYPRGAVLGT